ncbi:OLC1v1034848C1 [Oldenlandia corymbosa var. corymbosa]|uniref:OLC1v1034848C1 n=1 Tax=Oldenlandia corymbosa var. corymbosa TaxID=529605 RepID=A0AAV1CUL3_OLDCO|nr:OLC1v1034848C1 [Oldenlandia corymbosa var. corymbosa]
MEQAMSYSIVVRSLGRNFTFAAIKKTCLALWKPEGDINLVDSIDGYHEDNGAQSMTVVTNGQEEKEGPPPTASESLEKSARVSMQLKPTPNISE